MIRPLTGLLAADGISMLGSHLSALAVPWLVLDLTGSPARVGLAAFAQTLPYVLAGLASGPIVDRHGARRLGLLADTGSAIALALLALAGPHSFTAVLVLAAAAGSCGGVSATAKRALLPRAAELSAVSTGKAALRYDGISRTAILLGYPLGGLLVTLLGAPAVLGLDALSFGLCAVLVAASVPRRTQISLEVEVQGGYGVSLRAGLAFIGRDRLVASIVGMLFLTNLMDQALSAVFLPVWVHDGGSPATLLGLLGGIFGLGALLGNLAFGRFAARLPRYLTFAVCFLVAGSPRFFALALTDRLWLILAVSFCSGLAVAALNPIMFAAGYEQIPPHLHGRVLGAIGALSWLGVPLGGLLGGLVIDAAGVGRALLAAGVLYLLVTVVPFVAPSWRRLDAPPLAAEPA